MRLRKLYIKGFKSFADETIINFDERVIGVVGPNGSGKSNIIDAIRWVLGEQKSKDLRLNKMTDVIFNGTKKRKSSGVAQVALTFDNTKNLLPTDYDTVTVSRLLYRSGESEYRLNDVTCRLKDIQSLFIDTGIGSNSYAIIALGMVDDILADKENARRKMFEQAAGVSKFKKRKKETLNKLKLTEADLNRVEDLLYELEQNLKSLEKQAKKTLRYNEVKQSYRDLSVIYSRRKVLDVQEKFKKLDAKRIVETDNFEKYNTQSLALEAEIQSTKANNIDKEKNLSSLQKELNELINEQRNQEYQKDLLVEKINYNLKRITEIENEKSGKLSSVENFGTSLSSLQKDKSVIVSELEEISVRLDQAKHENEQIQANFNEMKSSFDAFTLKRIKANEELQSKETQKAVVNEQLLSLTNEKQHTEQRINAVLTQLNLKETGINQLEEKSAHIHEQIIAQEDEKAKQSAQKQQLNTRLQEVDAEVGALRRKLDARQNEVDLLEQMIQNLEGYPESIKFLHDEWQTQAPLLSDVLKVDNSVRLALEQYLDSYLNYYVCDTMDQAINAISLLKRSEKGKANFFILDHLEQATIQQATSQHLTPASNFVQSEYKYQKLISKLLGNAFIYDGQLNQLNGLTRSEHDILAINGTFVKTKQSISGGSVGLFEGNKLGRQQKLESLKETIIELNATISRKENVRNDIEKQLSALDEQKQFQLIENLKVEQSQINEELVKLKTELDFSREQNSEWLGFIESAAKSIVEKQSFLQTIETELTQIREELTSDTGDNEISDKSLDMLAQKLAESTEKVNAVNIEYLKKQSQENSVQLELDYNQQQEVQIRESIQQNDQIKANLTKENEENQAKAKLLENKLLAGYEHKKSFEEQLTNAEQSYFKVRGEINEKEDALKALHRKIAECQSVVNGIKDKQTSFEFTISGIYERVDLEFGMTKEFIDSFELDEDDERSLGEIELQVNKLKSRYHNFGEVNPLALEAYEEMKERYDSISSQREDIVTSKASLLETIEEIELKATDQYMDAFNRVKVNFKEVFRSLFSEDDDCDLVLLEGASPLEANIEIVAKPKGKKPKSLSQLSGGEKTLTATALLFALYLLKPAPFCIFDEVDAPLDDTNVQKFNKIIKKFSGESQFIIVTHNKLTMAEVDVLYGVYMAEQGVSGLSPVDFRDYKYDPIVSAN
jgi:chromosome segregation protein